MSYITKTTILFEETWIWYNTHHIILITSGKDQRVRTIITPSMNTSYMWPVDTRFTDLANQLFKTTGFK